MSIQEDIFELQSLETEMKRLRKELQQLRAQKLKCEQRILAFLEKSKQPGVKFNGKTILTTEKSKRKYQRKQDKLEKGMHILKKYGISSTYTEQALGELLENMRGTPETVRALKIT